MGIIELIGFSFGEAFSFSIIWFTVVSLFFVSPLKQKSKWEKGFIFTLIILTLINAAIKNLITKQVDNEDLVKIYAVQSCIIPIFVSIFYWVVLIKLLDKSKIKQH